VQAQHGSGEYHERDDKDSQDDGEGISPQGGSNVDADTLDLIVVHDHDAHGEDDGEFGKKREKKKEELLIILFSNASSKPRAVVIHLFYADATYIAMGGPWRTINIASHAKFYRIHLYTIRNDVRYLYMASNMLIFGDQQELAIHFIFFVLNRDRNYDFLNYAGLSGGDPDEGVKVDELENNEHSDEREIMLSAKPA
jgi:hypothetical protein